jgi:hypothetical protein
MQLKNSTGLSSGEASGILRIAIYRGWRWYFKG